MDSFLLLPGDGLVLVQSSGVVCCVDRAARERMGPDAEAMIGADVSECWPELAAVIAVHGPWQAMTGVMDVAVGWGAVEIPARLFRTDDGVGLGLLAPAVDRAGTGPSLALYDRVLGSVSESIIVTAADPLTDPGPIIVFANDTFMSHTGYSRAEVLGRSPRMMQGPDTDPAAGLAFRTAFMTGSSAHVEMLSYKKDGTPFWVELDMAPVADAGGVVTHWVWVERDVTERHANEAEGAARDAMVQTILDSMPVQTALLDPSGVVIGVNAAWRRLRPVPSGTPLATWLGVDYLGVDRHVTEDEATGIRRVLQGGADKYGCDYSLGDRGDETWYHMQVVPLPEGNGAVVTHAYITQRRAAESAGGQRRMHDALTGLATREVLLRRVDEELARARQSGTRVALVCVDLDDFKDVNDAFGHQYGDLLLEMVARRLEKVAGPRSLVARLAGDAFALLLTELSIDWNADRVFEGVRAALAEPINLGIGAVRVSASLGVVKSPPHSGDALTMLGDAETALHESKRSGRDRMTRFLEGQRAPAVARLVSQGRVSQALDRDEFVLHYQPVVGLAHGRTIGSEALLRWNSPEEGLLLPGRFLAALESGPLIEEVGAWVLDQALATQARWQAVPGHAEHLMSVNVSARQLGLGHLPDLVGRLLDRHGVPPSGLQLEILETSLVHAGALAEDELRELHDFGVRIAIDDFGTGYSSVGYLQNFPVDALKIDRSLVVNAIEPRAVKLLAAVGGLAHAVGAYSVAEGIETPEQVSVVRDGGIDAVQGFLLGKPEPAGAAPAASLIDV